ncbi:hypothetical protein LIER_13110 [Lithospermum erythrorhizon]|uniref:Uncharacterized protein n=1 Tax=Lithospermum erythrorhizon TaxID=34254 RepID=A0AAV3PVQ5_LITER
MMNFLLFIGLMLRTLEVQTLELKNCHPRPTLKCFVVTIKITLTAPIKCLEYISMKEVINIEAAKLSLIIAMTFNGPMWNELWDPGIPLILLSYSDATTCTHHFFEDWIEHFMWGTFMHKTRFGSLIANDFRELLSPLVDVSMLGEFSIRFDSDYFIIKEVVVTTKCKDVEQYGNIPTDVFL